MPIAAILSLLQAGGAIAQHLVPSDKAARWIELGKQAAAGVQSAIVARDKIELWAASGRNPTAAELDAVLDESRDLHEAIQNS